MTLFQSWRFLGSDYPGVGGGTPIFSYIFRFGALLLVQNFRKVILLGVRRVVDIWGEGGSLRYQTIFFWGGGGAFLSILGLFKVKIQNGICFWTAKFQIFLGMPDIPDFFFLWGGGGGGVKQ